MPDGYKPDGCVIDDGMEDDCVYATQLVREGKGKTACKYWRPVTTDQPTVTAHDSDVVVIGEGLPAYDLSADEPQSCIQCEGSGRLLMPVRRYNEKPVEILCENCGGTGTVMMTAEGVRADLVNADKSDIVLCNGDSMTLTSNNTEAGLEVKDILITQACNHFPGQTECEWCTDKS
jgi:hypothetical protein